MFAFQILKFHLYLLYLNIAHPQKTQRYLMHCML